MVRFGADRAEEYRGLLRGRVALLTAASGQTAGGQSTVDCLRELCGLSLLLAPEHGVRGEQAAGEPVPDGVDTLSGLPVISLYGGGENALLPEQALERFDTLVYDVQDVGCRFYTFISTLRGAAQSCARAGKRLVIFDRADPLGGFAEGLVLEEGCRSFVGCCSIPIRYGLTCGEFARMVCAEEAHGCDLQVVPCEGLRQEMLFPELGRRWIAPSPALPRWENALLYAGTCLIEGTNCSEGRGTDDPFARIGAPYIDGNVLARELNLRRLPGVTAEADAFVPSCSKHAGKRCGGVHLRITDPRALRPTEMGLHLLDLLRRLYPEDFALLPPSAGEAPFLSKLAGTRALERPDWTLDALLERAKTESEGFERRCAPFRLYGKEQG